MKVIAVAVVLAFPYADQAIRIVRRNPASRTGYVAGEIVHCDRWFPPVQLLAGFGQVRRPVQLPVLTMVTGYSRWLPAVLIPSRKAEDLFAGWWQLIAALGAGGRIPVWDGEDAIGRWGRQDRADRRVPGVPLHPSRQGDGLQACRRGGHEADRAGA